MYQQQFAKTRKESQAFEPVLSGSSYFFCSRDKTEFNYFKTTICTWVTHSSEIHNSRAGNHYQMITNV
jgi:hypothetical protein